MTKKEALVEFREYVAPMVYREYGRDDKPAICEAWNNFTDSLREDKRITMRQYETWTNPY